MGMTPVASKQVCAEVCSPPVSMFIPTTPAESTTSAREATATKANFNTPADSTAHVKKSTGGAKAYSVPDNNFPSAAGCSGATPDPFFASSYRSPSIYMDPARVLCYRSLGLIVGLAVRTGVPLPSLRLSPTWWMLVTGETASLVDDVVATAGVKRAEPLLAAPEGEKTPGVSSEAAAATAAGDVTRTRHDHSCLDEAGSVAKSASDTARGSISALDGVLAALGRIRESGSGKDELEKVLADARFVAPLSNGQMVELLPGGESQEQGLIATAFNYLSNLHLHGATKKGPLSRRMEPSFAGSCSGVLTADWSKILEEISINADKLTAVINILRLREFLATAASYY